MNAALILSGGSGTRIGGDIPKQYIELGGKPIISYCIEVFEKNPGIDRIYIVADEKYRSLIEGSLSKDTKFAGFADPGENRQLSILSGLEVMRPDLKDEDNVIIHDAARPLVSQKLIESILSSLEKYDAVLPILPMKDTVYEVTDGMVTGNLDRSRIAAGQAPEGFVFGKYLNANKDLLPDKILEISGSMQPAVMSGMKIKTVAGDENNFKITTPADLKRFEDLID